MSAEEGTEQEDLIHTRKRAASVLSHARILLKAEVGDGGPGWDDKRIVEALECGACTVYWVRRAFVEKALAAALLRKLDGAQEAQLIGQQPLARRAGDLAPAVAGRSAGRTGGGRGDQPGMRADDLKKTNSSRGCASRG